MNWSIGDNSKIVQVYFILIRSFLNQLTNNILIYLMKSGSAIKMFDNITQESLLRHSTNSELCFSSSISAVLIYFCLTPVISVEHN